MDRDEAAKKANEIACEVIEELAGRESRIYDLDDLRTIAQALTIFEKAGDNKGAAAAALLFEGVMKEASNGKNEAKHGNHGEVPAEPVQAGQGELEGEPPCFHGEEKDDMDDGPFSSGEAEGTCGESSGGVREWH